MVILETPLILILITLVCLAKIILSRNFLTRKFFEDKVKEANHETSNDSKWVLFPESRGRIERSLHLIGLLTHYHGNDRISPEVEDRKNGEFANVSCHRVEGL